jgi:hypothetical protein
MKLRTLLLATFTSVVILAPAAHASNALRNLEMLPWTDGAAVIQPPRLARTRAIDHAKTRHVVVHRPANSAQIQRDSL